MPALINNALYSIISVIGVGFLIVLLFVALLITHWLYWNSAGEVRHSLAYAYLLRITGVILIAVKHILFQPLVTILMLSSECSTDSLPIKVKTFGYECYSNTQIILIVLGVLLVILLIVITSVAILFLSDEEPVSRLPWAHCGRSIEVYKLIRKVVVSVGIYIAEGNKSIGGAVIVISLLVSLITLLLLYKQLYMPDKKVLFVVITTEGLVAWFTLLLGVYLILDVDWLHPFVLGAFTIILLICTIFTYRERCDNLLCQRNIDSIKGPEEVETYSRVLLERLHFSKNNTDVSISGFVHMHAMHCDSDQCPCRKAINAGMAGTGECCEEEAKLQDCKKGSSKELKGPKRSATPGTTTVVLDLKPAGRSIGDEGEGRADKVKSDFMKIVINDLATWKAKHETTARLDVYIGYLKTAVLKNKLAALYEVMCASDESPSVYEQYMGYRLSRKIEDQIMKKESRENSTAELDHLILFQQILAEMQENMQEVLKQFIGFWKELQDESPNFQYLGNISHDISQRAVKIRSAYKQLITINPTNLYCRMLYALFLRKIMKDEFEAYEVYDE